MPSVIAVAGSVYHRVVMDIAAYITGCISHINNCGRVVVYIHVLDVVDGTTGWDSVDDLRDRHTYNPWPEGVVGNKPHCFMTGIIFAVLANADH
jgi:hypothetical protein